MSETVARTGWPCSPQTSQNATGQPPHSGSGSPSFFRRSPSLSDIAPALAMPPRSPFTSAMKTGTPIREKRSASTCSEIVLPVPVAPVMQPWRLASAGRRATSVSPWRAMTRGSAMVRVPAVGLLWAARRRRPGV